MLSPRLEKLPESLGLGFLGLALPLLFFPPAEDAFRLTQLACLCIAALCLALAPLNWRPTRLAGLGLAFFAWRLISQLKGGFQLAWTCEQLLYAWIFFWAAQRPDPAASFARLKPALLAGAALSAAYGLMQSFGFDPWAKGQMAMGFDRRAHASLGNPDFFGGYLVLIFPLALGDALLKGRRIWLALLLGAALMFSQTRAAWLAAAAALALILWQGRKAIRWPTLLVLALALLGLAALSPERAVLAQRLGSTLDPKTPSASGRFFLYEAAGRIALKNPLIGAGGGNFTDAFLSEQGPMLALPRHASQPYRMTHDAHNDWLQVAAESGIPALLVLLGLWFLLFRGQDWQLGAPLLAFAVDALFSFPLAVPASAGVFWMLAGLSASKLEPPRSAPGLPAWPLALFFMLIFAFFLRQFQASVLLNSGMRLSLAGDYGAADSHLKASLRIDSTDYRPWLRLGLNADARNDPANAALAFQGAIQAMPGMASAWSNLGLAEGKAGHLEQAEAASLKALELNPAFVEALGNLGKIKYLKGQIHEAEAIYRRGIEIDPRWTQGHYNLAAICVNSGRKAEAREILKKLLGIDPGHAQANQLLRAIP